MQDFVGKDSVHLMQISWQIGSDARLLRHAYAATEENVGQVLARVLAEAFVMGYIGEGDAFFHPEQLPNRWQVFIQRGGRQEPLRLDASFATQKVLEGDLLVLRPLPRPAPLQEIPLDEEIAFAPQRRTPVGFVVLGVLFVAFAALGGWWWTRPVEGPPMKAPLRRVPPAEPAPTEPASEPAAEPTKAAVDASVPEATPEPEPPPVRKRAKPKRRRRRRRKRRKTRGRKKTRKSRTRRKKKRRTRRTKTRKKVRKKRKKKVRVKRKKKRKKRKPRTRPKDRS